MSQDDLDTDVRSAEHLRALMYSAEVQLKAPYRRIEADDDFHLGPPVDQEPPKRKPIMATPFKWVAPSAIPPRRFLYGSHIARKYLSATISPGGVGKSSLALTEAMAMASGRALLGIEPPAALNVWYWNGEDPIDETQRRIAAICKHYLISPADFDGRLFIDTGRETEISIAKGSPRGLMLNDVAKQELIETIHEFGIDVVIIDPFVPSHEASENDNGHIAAICKRWAQIADETSCAIEFVHHARKMGAGSSGDVTADDARGASALLAAVRSARTLNQMTKEDAEKAKVERPRSHVRIDDVKANLAPPAEGARWFKLIGIPLDNETEECPGDEVAVVTAWKWPDPNEEVTVEDVRAALTRIAQGEGEWRLDQQSKNWVGQAIADALGQDIEDRSVRSAMKLLVQKWLAEGWLKLVTKPDAKRRPREFVEPGESP
ncbi:MAG: helicase RepA family protein [Bosea sp. (in: a-proteobacteria)]|nr:helicase RepA family protein [Bosea sp. (in: a-proteobacteria)]